MFRRFALLVLALIALLIPACLNEAAVDDVFCDADESCYTELHTGVFCGGVECPKSDCYVNWHCGGPEESECRAEMSPEWDDHNACTVDSCGPNGLEHTPYTPADLDDGDPCTLDECSAVQGITHLDTCS